MISAHLMTNPQGEPVVKLTKTFDKITRTWFITPDDAAFLFFDLDDVLKEIRQRTPTREAQ
jgi:hypothetical protein